MTINFNFVFLYICCVGNKILVQQRSKMFSPEFMKYLINYQKSEFTPQDTKKEIRFKNRKSGKLAEIYAVITKQVDGFEL